MTDSADTTPAPAVDPVADIGREIERLSSRMEELENEDNGGHSIETTYRTSEIEDLYDRIECLRAYATAVKATSTDGAAVQVGLLGKLFHDLLEFKPDGYEAKATEQRFMRTLFSVLRVLGARIEADLPAIGVYRLAGEHLNPWVPYETRVAVIEEEHSLSRRRARA